MTQEVNITEYLKIDLSSERWKCRCCNHEIAPARQNYKTGLLVCERDPREVHDSIIDPSYEYTFAPDPTWCRIVEFYCPERATMIEVEYLPPGHPLTHDIELDIDSLKVRHAAEALKAKQEETA